MMMNYPYLYASLADLKAQGGSYNLSDVVSMSVTEERNGAFDLEMRYLYSGENAEQIQCERFIMAKPQRETAVEPFRIYEVTTPIDGVITIKAHHISYDLDGYVLQPFLKTGITNVINEVNNQLSALGADFRLANNGIINTSSQFSISFPQSAASVLGQGLHSLVAVFDAELSYAWDIANQREVITLNASRGVASTATVAYGFNLLSLDSKVNSEAVYSHIYPYVKITENDVTTLITLPEKTLATGATTSRDRTLLVDLSSEFQAVPTVTDLRNAANAYLQTIDWDSQESCSFDFVPLQNTTEYQDNIEEQLINLCDTITVDASVIGVQRTAKIVRTEYNQLTDKYDSMTVGMIEANIADTIAGLSNNEGKSLNVPYLPLTGGTVGDLNVDGDLSATGDLNIGGDIVGNNTFTGNVQVDGTLSCGNRTSFKEFTIAASGTATIDFPNGRKGLVILSGGAATVRTALIVNTTNTGVVSNTALRSASSFTYTTGTNTLTIANSSTNQVRGLVIYF